MKLDTGELYQPIQSWHVICLGISNKSVAVSRQDSMSPALQHTCTCICTVYNIHVHVYCTHSLWSYKFLPYPHGFFQSGWGSWLIKGIRNHTYTWGYRNTSNTSILTVYTGRAVLLNALYNPTSHSLDCPTEWPLNLRLIHCRDPTGTVYCQIQLGFLDILKNIKYIPIRHKV